MFQDVDVFLAPFFNMAETAFYVTNGRPVHPVNVPMTNHPVRCIETFDLHICQCGHLGVVLGLSSNIISSLI